MRYAVIGLSWLLHFLPYRLLALLGLGTGHLLYYLLARRRRITLTNLRLCFPTESTRARRALARAHFRAYGRMLLEHSLLWWSKAERLQSLIHCAPELLAPRAPTTTGQSAAPVLYWVPHFVCLEIASYAMVLRAPVGNSYQRQRDRKFDTWLTQRRVRFGNAQLFPREAGVRPLLRLLQQGVAVIQSADMDFGTRGAVFAPFFGVPAATVTGPFRLAQLAGAAIVPLRVRFAANYSGWLIEQMPVPLVADSASDLSATDVQDKPNVSVKTDMAYANAYNAALEQWISACPEQYLWSHRRFKTRPAGMPPLY